MQGHARQCTVEQAGTAGGPVPPECMLPLPLPLPPLPLRINPSSSSHPSPLESMLLLPLPLLLLPLMLLLLLLRMTSAGRVADACPLVAHLVQHLVDRHLNGTGCRRAAQAFSLIN